MNIGLARTFLMICETDNFAKAAEKIFITQSTVSTRIMSLESMLGQTLFTRNKSITHMPAQHIL